MSLLLQFFVALLSTLPIVVLTADYNPEKCEPKSCGDLIVRYPFWIQGKQSDYCGFPPFELRCNDENTPPLLAALEAFHVLNISYESQTLIIAGASSPDCFVPDKNLSFSLTPFAVSSANRELIFASNCTERRFGDREINCTGFNSLVYLGGDYGSPDDDGVYGSCSTAVAPILSSPEAEVSAYSELLAAGFLLNWTAPDCSECRASHGQCGYNNHTTNFMCICSDKYRWRSCSNNRGNKALIIGLSSAGGLTLIVLGSLLYIWHLCWKKRNRSNSIILKRIVSLQASTKSDSEHSTSLHAPIFTYEELYEATNGFDASRELGDGGFGTVYKGKLRDGRVVAVKRLYESNYRRLEHFMNEVKILSLLRHPNLVSLFGCTSRRSRELLLVYEFVPNGTVADHLHGIKASESFMPWKVRMSIAIETADAINYLHSVEPPIIHRDVKTDNILLDNSFHVKVGDFGLSRLFLTDTTHISTAPQGTPGYVDPEYHQCYQLTDRSDVYSFGVVLMELVSSKPAVDVTRPRNEINLSNMAINKIQRQELHELVDPRLGYQSDKNLNRMIAQVAELAFQCLQSDRELRPCSKSVLDILKGIESGGFRKKRCEEVGVALEEARLLKGGGLPRSPDSVAAGWASTETTPNISV